MVCNLCGTQEATVHLTEIVNHQMIEIHLCDACAKEKGTDFKTHFNLGEILAGLVEGGKATKSTERRHAYKCSECGMTYEEFGKGGRLGCAECYESFAKMLLPLIKRVQRSTHHVGKRPSKLGPVIKRKTASHDLKILQERLQKSVQSEAFEEAARIRDEIRQFEEKTKKGKRSKHE